MSVCPLSEIAWKFPISNYRSVTRSLSAYNLTSLASGQSRGLVMVMLHFLQTFSMGGGESSSAVGAEDRTHPTSAIGGCG